MATETVILDTIAATYIGVAGLNDAAIYGPGGGTVAGVLELPDDIAAGGFPALVILPGPIEIIPGSWERQTWTITGTVWAEYTPRGERVRLLMDLREPLNVRTALHGKGGLADTAVQSVLLTSFSAIEGRQWQRGENAPWYLVLPFELEAKVNRPRTYAQA